jgi:hypothetical protein
MYSKSVGGIKDELVNIVTEFYRNQTHILEKMTPFEQQELYMETVSYLFRRYQSDFDAERKRRFQIDRESSLQMERKIFFLWCAQHVVQRISRIKEEQLKMLLAEE